ncbi:MAG: hypothetical protein IJK55_03930 [Bacteroidales bacterium]|nr:hypothetical protein [Bacteroidales bacterium]MBR4585314.1 hypothetical protein [Bacteroidales bacterium]
MRQTTLKYLLLLLAQIVLWNYFNFTQYLFVAFLPAMILCLPVSRSAVYAMVVAFLTGLAADFLVTGQLGLTSFALVPVALLRRPVITLVFGSELFARGEDLSFQRQGWQKFLLAVLLLTAVFLLLYLWVDDAGMHPFWFLAVKFAASLAVSTALSLYVANLMLEETGERWK